LEDGLSETLIAELTRLKMAPALARAIAYRAGLALARPVTRHGEGLGTLPGSRHTPDAATVRLPRRPKADS